MLTQKMTNQKITPAMLAALNRLYSRFNHEGELPGRMGLALLSRGLVSGRTESGRAEGRNGFPTKSGRWITACYYTPTEKGIALIQGLKAVSHV